MTRADAVRRRLVESLHGEWIKTIEHRTNWPRDGVVDILLAADCDRQRLHDAFERFKGTDNLNPFDYPPPHQRFLRFLQR